MSTIVFLSNYAVVLRCTGRSSNSLFIVECIPWTYFNHVSLIKYGGPIFVFFSSAKCFTAISNVIHESSPRPLASSKSSPDPGSLSISQCTFWSFVMTHCLANISECSVFSLTTSWLAIMMPYIASNIHTFRFVGGFSSFFWEPLPRSR